jgi:hypothetical protein
VCGLAGGGYEIWVSRRFARESENAGTLYSRSLRREVSRPRPNEAAGISYYLCRAVRVFAVHEELLLTLDAGAESLGVAEAEDTGVVDLGLDKGGVVLSHSQSVSTLLS